MLIKSRWVVRFRVGLRQVVRLARKIDRSTKRFFRLLACRLLPPFLCAYYSIGISFISIGFVLQTSFVRVFIQENFQKKIFTKILIGDFRFLCKKRISKDKFGIKMLGNVYTEEITL